LLYNPQIQVLLICGHDRSGSRKELENFFTSGLVEIQERSPIRFLSEAGLTYSPMRISGTQRLLDPLVMPDNFPTNFKPKYIGDPKEETTIEGVQAFFRNWQPNAGLSLERPKDVPPLPEVETQYFPSNPRAHQVVRDKPLEAWLDVLHLLSRFGRRVTLKKGERLELQNLKVVVEEPEPASREDLLQVNLDPDKLDKYFREFLQGELRPDEAYTYGHRLRTYFGLDAVEILATRLQKDPEDRKAYFTLWDNHRDLTARESRPCFVSAFFRKFQEKLTLTATFRTHNAMDAWLLNFYGLMAFQQEVARRVVMEPGALTVFSHSISLDPKELDRALTVVGKRKWKMHLDPMGYFRVTLDGDEILVEHRSEDVTLKEYRGRTAVGLQHQIARDVALSDINHAMYLGRQLAKAEMALKEGREFVQD
jgi:thymidylate synthase